jgi:hypothetical protein
VACRHGSGSSPRNVCVARIAPPVRIGAVPGGASLVTDRKPSTTCGTTGGPLEARWTGRPAGGGDGGETAHPRGVPVVTLQRVRVLSGGSAQRVWGDAGRPVRRSRLCPRCDEPDPSPLDVGARTPRLGAMQRGAPRRGVNLSPRGDRGRRAEKAPTSRRTLGAPHGVRAPRRLARHGVHRGP